jgi:hypothetical protein
MQRQIVSPRDAAEAQRHLGVGESAEMTNTAVSDTVSPDDYKDRLLKLIPTEVVAAYLTLDGIIRSSATGRSITIALWVAFGVGTVATWLYLQRLQKVGSLVQLAVSTVAFAVWVFALGGPFARYDWYQPWLGSVVLVIVTLAVPLFVGREKAPS